MNRNDDSLCAWWTLTIIVLFLQQQEMPIPPLVTFSVIWLITREFFLCIMPLLRDLRDCFRARKRYRDSLPSSKPVPFCWWRKTEPDMTERYNHFAGWFEEGVFSQEALHALFDHFINNNGERYLTAPGAVCVEWKEYTKEQLCEEFAFVCIMNGLVASDLPDDVFEMVAEQIRSRTSFYELQHKTESGEVFYTYLVRGF